MKKVKLLASPYIVQRKAPLNTEPGFDACLKKERQYKHTLETSLLKIRNSYITHYGPILAGLAFAPSLSSQTTEKPLYLAKLFLSCLKKIFQKKVKRVDVPVLVVHNNYTNNYYHWVTEVFFRLFLVRENLETCKVVLPKTQFSFQQTMLDLLSIRPQNIVEIEPENLIYAKEIYTPQYAASYGNYQPTLMRNYAAWLKNALALEAPNAIEPIFIYISRNRSAYRRVTNEDTVLHLLKQYKFHEYYLEDLPFREQAVLFHNASIIITPHGAGLTNLIFCRPGTTVIELFPESYIHTCYYTMADVFDLAYYYQANRDVIAKANLKVYQYDMQVNLLELETLLQQAIASS